MEHAELALRDLIVAEVMLWAEAGADPAELDAVKEKVAAYRAWLAAENDPHAT